MVLDFIKPGNPFKKIQLRMPPAADGRSSAWSLSTSAQASFIFSTLPSTVLSFLAYDYIGPQLTSGALTWLKGATLRAKLSAGLLCGGAFAVLAVTWLALFGGELCEEKEEKQIRFEGRELVCHPWVQSAVATLSFGLSAVLGLLIGALAAVLKKPLYMLIALALALVGWRRLRPAVVVRASERRTFRSRDDAAKAETKAAHEAAPARIRYGPNGGVRPRLALVGAMRVKLFCFRRFCARCDYSP